MDHVRILSRAITGRLDPKEIAGWPSTEWDELVRRAAREGVAPLLHQWLETTSLNEIAPDDARRTLAHEYYNTAAGNIVHYHELGRILEALGSENTIVLKGADLAATLYPNIALRPMGDIDILVRPDHVDNAFHTLAAIGYEPSIPEMAPGFNRLLRHGSLLHRAGSERSVGLDLHWGLVSGPMDRRAPKLEWFWVSAEDGAYRSQQGDEAPLFFRRLSPTAHLLYLAAHLLEQHREEDARLIWYYDIHLLCTGRAIPWDDAFERAAKIGWDDALSRALSRCSELLGTELPQAALDHVGTAIRQYESAPPATRGVLSEWRNLSFRGRAVLLRGLLFPTRRYLQWRYRPKPPSLWPLWYPVRWLSLLAKAFHRSRPKRVRQEV